MIPCIFIKINNNVFNSNTIKSIKILDTDFICYGECVVKVIVSFADYLDVSPEHFYTYFHELLQIFYDWGNGKKSFFEITFLTIDDVDTNDTNECLVKKNKKLNKEKIDVDKILESDLLRWLLSFHDAQSSFCGLAAKNLKPEDLKVDVCRKIYHTITEIYTKGKSLDLLTLATEINDSECQKAISEILERRMCRENSEKQFIESLQKILDRNWMELREAIKVKIQSGNYSENESMDLVSQFDKLIRTPPKIKN